MVYLGLIGFWSFFFILLLFTKEQDVSGRFSVVFYRHRGGEAPNGLGPIRRTVLGLNGGRNQWLTEGGGVWGVQTPPPPKF